LAVSGKVKGLKNRHWVSTTSPMTGLLWMSSTPERIRYSFTTVSK
jgi:hypothetical protein